MRKNYEVVFMGGYKFAETIYFHYKNEAISCAKLHSKVTYCYIRSMRTKKKTYILPREFSSCMVCGNELGGKKFCGLCKTQHVYA